MKVNIGLTVAAMLLAGSMASAESKLVEAADVLDACAGDIKTFCTGEIVGGTGLKACMKSHLTQLSDQCFGALMSVVTATMPKATDYASTAKDMEFDDLRGVEYCELNLMYADIENDTLFTNMWNSSGLNNAADPKVTCPPDAWAKVDADALAKQNNVLGVWKNGPRGWTMDKIELPVGDVTTFDGWQGRWFASPTLPKGVDPRDKGASAYKPLDVKRNSVMTFNKGQPVFLLDAPDGTVWVLQAWDMTVDTSLTYESLKDLGGKLKMPEGWSFRTKVLDEDLVIKAVDGKARIMQDDLQGTFDACLPGMCSFVP